MRRGNTLLAAAVAMSMAALAACGSSSDGADTSGGSGGTITVAGVTFPKPEKTNLIMGSPSVALSGGMPVLTALNDDLFSLFGLHVEQKGVNGDSQAVQALIAGQLDFIDNSAGPLTSQRTSKPLKAIYIQQSKVADVLMSAGDVKTADDLKGKSIAVSNLGSYSYAEANLAIESLGLKASDVTFAPVGSDADRLAALKSGSVAAAVQDPQERESLESDGFNTLVDLSSVKTVGYVGSALTVPEEWLTKYPNTALALAAAYQLGSYLYSHRSLEENAEVWADLSELPMDEATADMKVEMTVGNDPADGRCNPMTYEFMKSVLVAGDPSLGSIDADAACTNDLIDKLADMKFLEGVAATYGDSPGASPESTPSTN